MNIYNITSKNEKNETIHKNDLKIVAAKKIDVHILCLKHLMLSAIRMRRGNSFQILVPVTRKVRPPSVSLLYLGHSTLKFE